MSWKPTDQQKRDFLKGAASGLGFSVVLVLVLVIASIPAVPIVARYAVNCGVSAMIQKMDELNEKADQERIRKGAEHDLRMEESKRHIEALRQDTEAMRQNKLKK